HPREHRAEDELNDPDGPAGDHEALVVRGDRREADHRAAAPAAARCPAPVVAHTGTRGENDRKRSVRAMTPPRRTRNRTSSAMPTVMRKRARSSRPDSASRSNAAW